MENTIDTATQDRGLSIKGYRESFPDASLGELIEVQSAAMQEYRRGMLGGTVAGVSFSVEEEVAKSIGRNDG